MHFFSWFGKKICFLIFTFLLFPYIQSNNGPSSLLAQERFQPIKVSQVIVRGNNYFSSGKIKSQSLLSKRWYEIFKTTKLEPNTKNVAQKAIDSLYHINGFWEAKVEVSYSLNEKKEAIVLINIEEGPQTKLKKVEIQTSLEELKRKALKEVKVLRVGESLDRSRLLLAAFNIKTVYANYGYPYAKVLVNLEQSVDKKEAVVVFEIEENGLVTFGEVFLDGLKLTKPKVAKRELTFKKGDIYSRAKIIDSQQRIYSTGLFSVISLEAKEAERKPQNPDFLLKMVEKKPYFISLKTGAGQNLQQDLVADFSGEWGNRNWAGSGRKISISAVSSYVLITKFQNLNNRFKVTFVEPWFLRTRTPLSLDAYYDPGVKSVIQPYRIESFGGNFSLSKELSRFTRIWLTGSYQQVNIFDIPPSLIASYKEDQGINVRRKLLLSGENDTRSNIFIPLGGSWTQVYSELVGGFLGGDNHFFKLIVSWSRYIQPTGARKLKVLAGRLKVGWVEGFKDNGFVPSFDRFYMGGASSIRGYAENSLGPKDEFNKTVGGKLLTVANLELRRALFWKFGYSLFLDSGNLWSEPENVNLQEILLSGGAGIQYFTPLGPLRLDYGRRILKKNHDSGGRWHVSILYSF